MKFAVFASLLAGAAAFAPSQTKQASTSALQAFDDDFGASKWDGGAFDPLGLVADGDQAKFDRLRLTEVKHGRELNPLFARSDFAIADGDIIYYCSYGSQALLPIENCGHFLTL